MASEARLVAATALTQRISNLHRDADPVDPEDMECASCRQSVVLLEGREATDPMLCDPCAQDIANLAILAEQQSPHKLTPEVPMSAERGATPVATPEDVARAHAVLRGGVLDFEATGVFSGLEVQAWPVIEAAIAAALARQRSRAEAAEARVEERERIWLGRLAESDEREQRNVRAAEARAVAAEERAHERERLLRKVLELAVAYGGHALPRELRASIDDALASAPAPVPSTPASAPEGGKP